MKTLAIYIVRIYQKFISPQISPRCIFYPTCSEYSLRALNKYGFIKGSYKSIKRIIRCNPLNTGGYDPLD